MEVVAQGANGIEAVELIEEHHPDMVFLDVQMPGLDGFAVIERLLARRAKANGNSVPKAVFSSATKSPRASSEQLAPPQVVVSGATKSPRANSEQLAPPQVVFATAYDQYAVRAFDVNAVDYLLKPFDRTRVEQAVERVRGRLISASPGSLPE